MKLGILDTVPRSFWHVDAGITDAEKFVTMLEPVMLGTIMDKFYVTEGEWPQQRGDYDAYLITGSPCSANDSDPWIETLQQFVRDCVDSQQKLVGICFGHQLIARALGGTVEQRADDWLIRDANF